MAQRLMQWVCGMTIALHALAATAAALQQEGAAASSQAGTREIPPFDAFFTPPSFVAPSLSPDGRWIAWISPVDGVNNFFVAPIGDRSARRQITFKQSQGVRPFDVSG